jgi:large subunit ribosomal protein L10
MPKTRSQKQAELTELLNRLARMKSLILSTNQGLRVADVTKLRKDMRAEQAEYCIVKKTILRRALAEAKIDLPFLDTLTGGFACSFGFEDEIAPAKLLNAFRTDHESVVFIGGRIGGAVYSGEEVAMIATLPSRNELRAKCIGSLQAPLSRFVQTLLNPFTSLVRILNARSSAP